MRSIVLSINNLATERRKKKVQVSYSKITSLFSSRQIDPPLICLNLATPLSSLRSYLINFY